MPTCAPLLARLAHGAHVRISCWQREASHRVACPEKQCTYSALSVDGVAFRLESAPQADGVPYAGPRLAEGTSSSAVLGAPWGPYYMRDFVTAVLGHSNLGTAALLPC